MSNLRSITPIVIHEGGGVTLVIATIGLGLSVLSVSWQAASFFLAGPWVRVRLTESSTFVSEGGGRSLLVQETLCIHVANRGRAATSIDECVIYPADGRPGGGLSAGLDSRTPTMPGHRLEPQSSTMMYLDLTLARTIAEERASASERPKVFAAVRLGNGRLRKSPPLAIPRSPIPPKDGTPAAGAHPEPI